MFKLITAEWLAIACCWCSVAGCPDAAVHHRQLPHLPSGTAGQRFLSCSPGASASPLARFVGLMLLLLAVLLVAYLASALPGVRSCRPNLRRRASAGHRDRGAGRRARGAGRPGPHCPPRQRHRARGDHRGGRLLRGGDGPDDQRSAASPSRAGASRLERQAMSTAYLGGLRRRLRQPPDGLSRSTTGGAQRQASAWARPVRITAAKSTSSSVEARR